MGSYWIQILKSNENFAFYKALNIAKSIIFCFLKFCYLYILHALVLNKLKMNAADNCVL